MSDLQNMSMSEMKVAIMELKRNILGADIADDDALGLFAMDHFLLAVHSLDMAERHMSLAGIHSARETANQQRGM